MPLFKKDYFGSNSGYLVPAFGGTQMGGSTAYNVNPLRGVMAGNALEYNSATPFPGGTAITAFSANTAPSPQPTGSWIAGSTVVTPSSTSGIQLGMTILDEGGSGASVPQGGCIPNGTYVVPTTAPGTIGISQAASCTQNNTSYPAQLSISGTRQLV
ncbi:MAG: hypothetical protein ACRELF_19835, partial [Gemmataceae bacterium]